MRKIISVLLLTLVVSFFSCAQVKEADGLSFLHTEGQNIVNASGNKINLEGVALGNWLLPEGYMWKFGSLGDRPWKIEKVVAELIGEKKARDFWSTYRKSYISEADVKRIAQLGFNCVRPALNARLFLTSDGSPNYNEEGFRLIDSLVSWCKKYKVYVIIDMHAAPGGQTGANIDDSRNNTPELFIDQKYQDELTQLWVKIAKRYKEEAVVAAYDLLNEPLPVATGAATKYKNLLVPLYKRITSEIRKVDQKHMITLEGFNWANDWSLFDKPFDSNVVYQFHYYCWARPDNLNSIDKYLRKRSELNTPVWVGETGEKDNAIYWATSQYLEANNIGFSFWPWKKMDTKNTPYSIKKPANWDLISAYTEGGPKPDSMIAQKALNDLLQNIQLANCVYFEDVCNAILTRIPAKIEGENYGHEGFNRSYFVSDTLEKSKYYRKEESVQIELDSKDKDQFSSDQSIELHGSEWVVYYFKSLHNRKFRLTIRASAVAQPAEFEICINNKRVFFSVTNKDLREFIVGNYYLENGDNTIKFIVKSHILRLDWIKLN